MTLMEVLFPKSSQVLIPVQIQNGSGSTLSKEGAVLVALCCLIGCGLMESISRALDTPPAPR